MTHIRKGLALLLALLCVLAVPARAQAQESMVPYVQRMILYYQHYQMEAEEEIRILLDYITAHDPEQGALWSRIMERWIWCNEELEVPLDVLPDGLPEDDSLCILVLGYGLNRDGTMKSELLARLETALRCANKYPNAYIAVTGGETSPVEGVTEAGEMARWLLGQGLDPERLIVEDKALSTKENATRTYRILLDSYPSVTSVAVVSSSYHVSTGCALFETVSAREAARGNRAIEVVGGAGASVFTGYDAMAYQAWGICGITKIPYDSDSVPELNRPSTIP